MTTGYKIEDQEGLYYVTLQIVGWIDIFTRKCYKDIIIESLRYCQQHKGLVVFAYVIMSNHIHLLIQSEDGKLSNLIRDFKSFTSKQILSAIEQESESRKQWMLEYFESVARNHKRNSRYQIWTHENHAEHIFSNKFIEQKLDYIHMNPVRSGIVSEPEYYMHSSATNYAGIASLLDVEIITTRWKTVR